MKTQAAPGRIDSMNGGFRICWMAALVCTLLPGALAGESGSGDRELAAFEGGRITLTDLKAQLAADYSQSPLVSLDRTLAAMDSGRQEELVRRLAGFRILSSVASGNSLALDATREIAHEVKKEKVLGGLYYRTRAAEAVEKARAEFLERCRAQYHRQPEAFAQPDLWTFRFILAGKPVDSGEAATPEEMNRFRMKAEEIERRLSEGGDFIALAKEFSANEEERRGVLLGPTTGEDQPPAIREALRELKTGEIGPPTETPFGYIILRCEEFSPAHSLAYEEALPLIEKRLGGFSPQPALQAYQKQMVKRYRPIEYHEDVLSSSPEAADAVVVSGTLTEIHNRDVFRPDIAGYLRDIADNPKDLSELARRIYWRRAYYLLALQEGFEQDVLSRAALQLIREQAEAQALLERLKKGERIQGVPEYKGSYDDFQTSLLSQYRFRWISGK